MFRIRKAEPVTDEQVGDSKRWRILSVILMLAVLIGYGFLSGALDGGQTKEMEATKQLQEGTVVARSDSTEAKNDRAGGLSYGFFRIGWVEIGLLLAIGSFYLYNKYVRPYMNRD